MDFDINIYTIIAAIVILFIFIWRIVAGFKHGFVRELSNVISLAVAFLVGSLIYKGVMDFFEKNFGKVIAIVLFLAIIMALFGLVKLIFSILKLFSSLPVLNKINMFFGALIGIVEGFLIVVYLIKFVKALTGIQ